MNHHVNPTSHKASKGSTAIHLRPSQPKLLPAFVAKILSVFISMLLWRSGPESARRSMPT